MLSAGPTPAKTLEAEARAAGLAWRTVRRAADELGVIRRKGNADSPAWYWSLSAQSKVSKEANLSTLRNVDNLDNLDTLPTPSDGNQREGDA